MKPTTKQALCQLLLALMDGSPLAKAKQDACRSLVKRSRFAIAPIDGEQWSLTYAGTHVMTLSSKDRAKTIVALLCAGEEPGLTSDASRAVWASIIKAEAGDEPQRPMEPNEPPPDLDSGAPE